MTGNQIGNRVCATRRAHRSGCVRPANRRCKLSIARNATFGDSQQCPPDFQLKFAAANKRFQCCPVSFLGVEDQGRSFSRGGIIPSHVGTRPRGYEFRVIFAKREVANPSRGPRDRAGSEWTLAQAPLDDHTFAAGLDLARRGCLDRDQQIVQTPWSRKPRVERRFQDACRLPQPLLRMFGGKALQKILWRDSRPPVKQPMKMRFTEPARLRDCGQSRLLGPMLLEISNYCGNAGVIIHCVPVYRARRALPPDSCFNLWRAGSAKHLRARENMLNYYFFRARVAELADALDSGSSE